MTTSDPAGQPTPGATIIGDLPGHTDLPGNGGLHCETTTLNVLLTAAGITPVWPTMSGLAKLMIPKRKSPSRQWPQKVSAAAAALISGLWS